MFFPYFDPTMIIVFPAILLALWAQFKVKSTFDHYSRIGNIRNYTGAQVARDILNRAGLHHIRIERIAGNLTDHYDPREQVVRLSSNVHDSTSLAAVGVAAHETGHALQHAEHYAPLGVRNSIVPVANIGSQVGLPLAVFGFFFGSENLILLGILLFSAAVLFQLVTLPVEFNASSRAMEILETGGFLGRDELGSTRKVLTAAALTYVAATIVAIAHLLRLLILYGMSNRRDD